MASPPPPATAHALLVCSARIGYRQKGRYSFKEPARSPVSTESYCVCSDVNPNEPTGVFQGECSHFSLYLMCSACTPCLLPTIANSNQLQPTPDVVPVLPMIWSSFMRPNSLREPSLSPYQVTIFVTTRWDPCGMVSSGAVNHDQFQLHNRSCCVI